MIQVYRAVQSYCTICMIQVYRAVHKSYCTICMIQVYRAVQSYSTICMIQVYRAKGLYAADLGGNSDPYCVLQLDNTRDTLLSLIVDTGRIFLDVKHIYNQSFPHSALLYVLPARYHKGRIVNAAI